MVVSILRMNGKKRRCGNNFIFVFISMRLNMDVRNKLIALYWADCIYRKLNNEEACDHDWWSQAFIVE